MKIPMRQRVFDALTALGYQAMYGKGGFWLKDGPFVTMRQAQRMTGIKPDKRAPRQTAAVHDMGWIAALNGARVFKAGG